MHNVLWLASWYPNRTDPFNGDFVERHARAVSLYAKLTILVVVKDAAVPAGKVEVVRSVEGNCSVYRAYYGRSRFGGIVEKFISSIRYYTVQKSIYRQIAAQEGQPALVHVHVAMKAGML